MAEQEKQDKGYEVKDKRRVNPDGTLREEAEAPEQQPQPVEGGGPEEQPEHPTEAAEPQKAEAPEAGEEMPPPDIYQTLQFMAGLIAEQAWQFMGLHLPPGRKEPVRDLTQAKIAIDTVVFINDKLHPHLDEESRKALRGLISDLQLNFVQHGQ